MKPLAVAGLSFLLLLTVFLACRLYSMHKRTAEMRGVIQGVLEGENRRQIFSAGNDELGRLALHTRIEDMQTSSHAVTVGEVRDIVDEAIAHANRKTIGHFIDIVLRRRYDEDDMIILREKDFI